MWPWEHLGIGYVAYLLVRPRAWWEADRVTLGALVLGTQLPDLVDKPLAWVFNILPSGRSLVHSLLFAVIVAVVAVAICRRYDRLDAAFAVTFGDVAHILLDAWTPFTLHQYSQLGFLFWPLTPAPTYDEPHDISQILHAFQTSHFSFTFFASLAAGCVVGAVFAYHFVVRAGRVGRARRAERGEEESSAGGRD